MHKDWKQVAKELSGLMAETRRGIPEVGKAFQQLAAAATAEGVLDTKTKELIALAIGITARCDGCVAFHAGAAVRHGANREEVLETIGMAIYMGVARRWSTVPRRSRPTSSSPKPVGARSSRMEFGFESKPPGYRTGEI